LPATDLWIVRQRERVIDARGDGSIALNSTTLGYWAIQPIAEYGV
jgi:hypothetical protein